MEPQRNVHIFLFDDVEVLDFAGPFEVFSVTGRERGERNFSVHTVAGTMDPVRARNGLTIIPCCTFTTCPPVDILVIPGGYGTRREMRRPSTIEWIQQASEQASLTLSVCTGALLLAKAGLLDGLSATTHHGSLELMAETFPDITVRPDRRIVDNGTVITSGGISAGIDMSLYVVSKLLGPMAAVETAEHMEYDWQPERYLKLD